MRLFDLPGKTRPNMAERLTVEVRKHDGSFASVKCPENVLNLLQDSSTDASIKSALHELLTLQVEEGQTSTDAEDGNKIAWNDVTEKLLLDQYKLVDPVYFPKSRWKTIADNINVMGYSFKPEQCRLKMKGLKQKKERLKRTGVAGLCPSLDTRSQDVDSSPSKTFPEIGRILSSNPEPCTREENLYLIPPVEVTADVQELPKCTWDEDTEKLVLEQFEVVDPGKITKTKWKKISDNINNHGYNFTANQCRMKIKAYLKRYKRLSKKDVKTPTADDNLSNIKDAFDSYPNITPVFTIDSGHLDAASTTNCPLSDQIGGKEVQGKNEEISDGPSTVKKRRKGSKIFSKVPSIDKLTNIEEMKAYLESLFGKKEAAVKKRHQEKMALWGTLISVIQDVGKKLTTNN